MLNETFLHTIDITTGVAVGSLIKNIRKNENFLNYINDKTSFLNFDAPIAVKLFYIRNRFDEQLKCKYCQTYITHIKSFCDRKCQGSYVGMNEDSKIKKSKTLSEVYSKKTQEEKDLIKHHRKETNLQKYGVENNMYIIGVREKTKKQWVEKYGFENPNKNEGQKVKISIKNRESADVAKQKRESTNLEKFGVANIMELQKYKDKMSLYHANKTDIQKLETRDKFENTNLQRYGITSYSCTTEFKERYKTTCNSKYGVDAGFQYEPIKDKIKQTCLLKYGHEHWLSSPLSRINYNPKNYTTLNKKMYDILKTIYPNEHIISEFHIKNEIINTSNFFDFYIKEENLLIEMQGDYWHMNPKKYKNDDIFMKGTIKQKFAYEVWEKDKLKLDNATIKGYYVLTIWESDFNEENIIKILQNKEWKN